MPCSYAGIAIGDVPADLQAWVETHISLDDLRETLPVSTWPGKNAAGMALPNWPDRPRLRLGQYFYPTGMSRWSEFHALASGAQIAAIKAKVYSTNQQVKPEYFVLQADYAVGDASSQGGIRTPLFLLPPRPLAFTPGTSNQGDLLYLLTLVDERYYFQFRKGGIVHPDGNLTWIQLFNFVGATLGLAPFGNPFEPVYGVPAEDSSLWSNDENAALLMDAVAANVGRVVVRDYDGNYTLQTYLDAGVAALANRPSAFETLFHVAGGDPFSAETQVDQAHIVPSAILPASVLVTFPKFVIGQGYVDNRDVRDVSRQGYGDVYEVEKTLTDAGYSQYQGHAGKKVFHDTARAYLNAPADLAPQNDAELQALSLQLARDFYAAQLMGVDEVFPGIRRWTLEGADDLTWTYRAGLALTRIQRKPWNHGIAEFQHAFTSTSAGCPIVPAGTIVARITQCAGGPSYSWVEVMESSPGIWATNPNGRNSSGYGLAYERNQDNHVEMGTVVLLYPGCATAGSGSGSGSGMGQAGPHWIFDRMRFQFWVRVASGTPDSQGRYPGFLVSGNFVPGNPTSFTDGRACWVEPPPQLGLVPGWYLASAESISSDCKLIMVPSVVQPGDGCLINEYECVDTRTWAPVAGTVICVKSPKDCCTISGSGSGSGSGMGGTPESLEINCGLGRIPRLRRVCLCPPLVSGSGSSGSGPPPDGPPPDPPLSFCPPIPGYPDLAGLQASSSREVCGVAAWANQHMTYDDVKLSWMMSNGGADPTGTDTAKGFGFTLTCNGDGTYNITTLKLGPTLYYSGPPATYNIVPISASPLHLSLTWMHTDSHCSGTPYSVTLDITKWP